MSLIPIPTEHRHAVRRAVNAHPGHKAILARLGKARVNELASAALAEACEELGINVTQIIAASHGAKPFPAIAAGDVPTWGETDPGADPVNETAPAADIETETEAAAIAREAAALRRDLFRMWGEGDFDGTTKALSGLLTEARKPAVVVTQNAVTGTSTALARPVGVVPWSAFGVTGPMAANTMRKYNAADAPVVDPDYIFRPDETASILVSLARGQSPWLFGPAGTGKTDCVQQIAARLGRPYRLISCDDTTEAPDLIGMRAPHDGSTIWLDGLLTAAIRLPGCIIAIDEPSIAREGALMVFQSVLQQRCIYVHATGERIDCAPDVLFVACDNTAGTGGGASAGYVGTRRLNQAFLDRFAVGVKFDYMDATTEAAILVKRAKCSAPLAAALVAVAGLSRTQAEAGTLTGAIGFRRLVAWASHISDGRPADIAFRDAVLHRAPDDDHEALRQLAVLACDNMKMAELARG
jgi:MoxR-like ATPase